MLLPPPAWESQTVCLHAPARSLESSQLHWLFTENFRDEPPPWLRTYYRSITATTRRSASGRGIGTHPLAVLPLEVLPLTREPHPSHILARLPTFPTKAADQGHATSMPDTAWPIPGRPPDLSRILETNPVLMPYLDSRHVTRQSSP